MQEETFNVTPTGREVDPQEALPIVQSILRRVQGALNDSPKKPPMVEEHLAALNTVLSQFNEEQSHFEAEVVHHAVVPETEGRQFNIALRILHRALH